MSYATHIMLSSFSNLNLGSWAGLAAIGAALAAGWRYIASFSRYFVGLFIGVSILKDHAGEAAMNFAFAKARKSPLGIRVFGGVESYVHPRRWFESIAYEGLSSDPVVFKYKKSYGLISLGGRASETEDIGDHNGRETVIKIKYFRWFFDIDNFVIDAVEHYNSEKRQRKNNNAGQKRLSRFKIVRTSGRVGRESEGYDQKGSLSTAAPSSPERGNSRAEQFIMSGIYRLLKWSREDLQMKPEEGKTAFTGYPFPKEVETAIQELDCWLKNEKWFRSKSIPWRRGWLLHGVPGTGKSTLVRALGMSFDLPVYIFDLSGITNNDLVAAWDNMMANTPCIALIEDIDAIFNGREYIGSSGANVQHLTFDCLLNCISGVKQADGVFLIVTTNHVDKLDPALGIPDQNGKSTRPGRIDKAIHLGLMAKEQRTCLANHILADWPDLIQETIDVGEGETAAQFQNRCAQLALSKFWNDDKFKNTTKEDMYVPVVNVKQEQTNARKEQAIQVNYYIGNERKVIDL
jgi:hypothetical protein